jgi:hypothetical protein
MDYAFKNVVGYGRGLKNLDGPVAKVFLVREKLPVVALSRQDLIPREMDGLPTDVMQVGDIVAQPVDRRSKIRPAPGGMSIGHFKITAGTLGAVVRLKPSGKRMILSNNHVLANSNDAAVGDAIYQPGPYDGGGPADQIATLGSFMPIEFGTGEPVCLLAKMYAAFGNGLAKALGSSHRVQALFENQAAKNTMDAALADPLDDNLIEDAILEVGVIRGAKEGRLGMPVRKSGRTTEFTEGTITVLDAVVQVSYGSQTAQFENQIVTTPMSQGGDSGSLLVDRDTPEAVGLLFAGSEQVTIHSPIQPILNTFGAEFL